MHLFHAPDLTGALIALPEDEAHHAVHVLRLKAGDRIGLLDGRGTKAIAELVEVTKKQVLAQVAERSLHPAERTAAIHLAVAPTKQQDRYEWFVEKAVEIGVDRITPLMTARTERAKLRTDRLERVAIAAMKQSQRTWLPAIDAPMSISQLLQEALPQQRCFGWCEGEHMPLMQAYDPKAAALVLIGPEGDFTPEETEQLRSAGFTAISLGNARLRTETAALSACTWMSFAQQR